MISTLSEISRSNLLRVDISLQGKYSLGTGEEYR